MVFEICKRTDSLNKETDRQQTDIHITILRILPGVEVTRKMCNRVHMLTGTTTDAAHLISELFR